MKLAAAALAAAVILSPVMASAAEPWLGRWIVEPKFCTEQGDTSETMPLIVTARTLEWFVARCTYSSATQRGGRWHLNARCSVDGSRGPTPIVLQIKGERLVVRWGGESPIEMQRCQ